MTIKISIVLGIILSFGGLVRDTLLIGSFSKSPRLAPYTAVGSKFSASSWLRESGCFAVVAITLALFRFSGPFQRKSWFFRIPLDTISLKSI